MYNMLLISMEQTKVVSVGLDNWGVAFRALGRAILFFLVSMVMVFVVTLPALGILSLIGVQRQFYVTAFVGYVVFNFAVTLKNWNMVAEAIKDVRGHVALLVLASVLVLNILFIVYPLIGWVLVRWISVNIVVWVPLFLMWWEVSRISGENRVLQHFTVTWLLVVIIKGMSAVSRVLHGSTSNEEEGSADRGRIGITSSVPAVAIVMLLIALFRK